MSARNPLVPLLALALLVAAPARGQLDIAPENEHYIDILGGFVWPDSGRNTRSEGYTGTFIYGAHLRGPLWIEGRLNASLFDTGPNAGTDFYQYGGGVDLVATLGDRTGFTPFALLGVGGQYNDVQPDSQDAASFRADAGLGLLTPALTSRGLKLRVEGRALYDTFRSGQVDFQASAGLSIPLGGVRVVEHVVEREVVREVVREGVRETPLQRSGDLDLDGVADAFDQCPNTLANARVDATGCIIEAQTIIVDDVHFDFDSDRLTPDAKTVLSGVAHSLLSQTEIHFEVAGHTDSRGSDDYNDRLSQARANSVMRFLVEAGIDRRRMSARGYGERQPLESNESEAGRARNRRVEFRIQPRVMR